MLDWSDVEQSQLCSWFGAHETGRDSRPNGAATIYLKPGGFQEFIDIEIAVDGEGRLEEAVLLLDRSWIEDEQTSPFAADITKSFLEALSPERSPARELAAYLERTMAMHSRVIRSASAPTGPTTEPESDVRAALDVCMGQQDQARLQGVDVTVFLRSGIENGRRRLRVELSYPAPPELPGHG